MAETTEDILRNLIAQGRITATGIRDFTLGRTIPIADTVTTPGTAPETIPGTAPKPDSVTPIVEVLPTYDEIIADELLDTGIVLEPELSPIDDTDYITDITRDTANELGLSEEDFNSLSENTNIATATTASVSNQGDKGRGIPAVPILDLSNALGSIGLGASPITLAAKAALVSAITTYVTNYVASQIAPLQMQVTAVASTVPMGAGKIAQIPGKIKSIISKIQSVKAKIKTAVAKVKSISQMASTVQTQIKNKVGEAKSKISEKVRLAGGRASDAANKVSERAGDTMTKARRTVTKRLIQPKSGIININKQITGDGTMARQRVTDAIMGDNIQQDTIRLIDPTTGAVSYTTITEAIGPTVATEGQQTVPEVTNQSSILGLPAIPTANPTPAQTAARHRAVDMYVRNWNSLSLAVTLYTTGGGGTRAEFNQAVEDFENSRG